MRLQLSYIPLFPFSLCPLDFPVSVTHTARGGRRVTTASRLVDVNTQLPQLNLGLGDLSHELLVRIGDVVEGEDAEAEAEEEECAERDEGPEGELRKVC
jgi:hypothetical protein